MREERLRLWLVDFWIDVCEFSEDGLAYYCGTKNITSR